MHVEAYGLRHYYYWCACGLVQSLETMGDDRRRNERKELEGSEGHLR